MNPGDIIIIPTTPPHVASVISSECAVCEDGVVRPYPLTATVAYTALEMLQSMEKEVMKAYGTG